MFNQQLGQILKTLEQVNQAYFKLFETQNPSGFFTQGKQNEKSAILAMKHYSGLFSKVFQFFQRPNVEQANNNKQQLLQFFKIFLKSFLNNTVVFWLNRCHSQQLQQYMHTLSQQWQNFKRFTFYYHALLQNAHDHYEQAYKVKQNRGQSFIIDNPDSVYPVSVIALNIFKKEVLQNNKDHIRKIIVHLWKMQRECKKVDKQSLRNVLQIVYSCGLGELGRIRSKNNQVMFYRQQKMEHIKNFKTIMHSSENFFKNYLLNQLIVDTQLYYQDICNKQIRPLSPIQDIMAVMKYVELQKQLSNYYLFTQHQKKAYMKSIYKVLHQKDIQQRVNRQNGIMSLLQKFRSDSQQHLHEISIFFKLLSQNKQATIIFIQKILKDHITNIGSKISKKINKHRQYISEMIELKKVINRIIEDIMQKDIRFFIVRDQAFRKLLDSLEASKCLAEYIDFIIKECIKLKLNQEDCLERFKNIFLISENLVAQDSLLIYHQEFLSKRLIDSLNQPRLQIQTTFIKKLAEKMGTISLSMHMSMIKDIQNSIQTTERYRQKMPFASFTWSIRIFNPVFWPDSLAKAKFQIQPPNSLFKQCGTLNTLYKQDFDYRNLNWKLDKGFSLFQGRFINNRKFRFQAQNVYLMLLLHISEQPGHKMLYGNLIQKIKPVKLTKDSNSNYLLEKYALVLVENKLLIRENGFADPLTEGQQLRVNMEYVCTNPNLKATQAIIIKPSPQMQKAFHQSNLQKAKIMKEREKLIEAALVKVMKHTHSSGGTSITFLELYKAIQTHNYLKTFEFSESTVKQRLQELLALGYCQRDEQDRKVYHYIA